MAPDRLTLRHFTGSEVVNILGPSRPPPLILGLVVRFGLTWGGGGTGGGRGVGLRSHITLPGII